MFLLSIGPVPRVLRGGSRFSPLTSHRKAQEVQRFSRKLKSGLVGPLSSSKNFSCPEKIFVARIKPFDFQAALCDYSRRAHWFFERMREKPELKSFFHYMLFILYELFKEKLLLFLVSKISEIILHNVKYLVIYLQKFLFVYTGIRGYMCMEFYVESRKGKHLTVDDRVKIERLLRLHFSYSAIARELCCNVSTISREVRRGQVEQFDGKLWVTFHRYSAQYAQDVADYCNTAKGRPEKIGHHFDYLVALESYILDNYSPAAAIAAVAADGSFPDIHITPSTFYSYLRRHYFQHITYSSLPMGQRLKRHGGVKRLRVSHPLHRSVEQRSLDILTRSDFGHWELDSVVGKVSGKGQSCLVLTERKTRLEMVLKVIDKTAKSTENSLRYLKGYFGKDFKHLFKTITCDNGTEFSDQALFDRCGVSVFYCHPSCPSERGSNECANLLVRRKLPKGESMAHVTQTDARRVQHWINNYPRLQFGYRSANQVLLEEMRSIPFSNPEKVKRFFGVAG